MPAGYEYFIVELVIILKFITCLVNFTYVQIAQSIQCGVIIPCIYHCVIPHSTVIKRSILTHWGRLTHICASKLTIIGSYNGLSPDRLQAIIWTKAGMLLIGPLGKNSGEIIIEIYTFSHIQENAFENVVWKMATILSRPQCVRQNTQNEHP